jgi:hypothetical protein
LFDGKSNFLNNVLNIFIYLYGFRVWVSAPHFCLTRTPSDLPQALLVTRVGEKTSASLFRVEMDKDAAHSSETLVTIYEITVP